MADASREYPYLEEEDLRPALEYAAAAVADEVYDFASGGTTRVLLDQGLSPIAAVLPREAGWDEADVVDPGLERSADEEVFAGAAATVDSNSIRVRKS